MSIQSTLQQYFNKTKASNNLVKKISEYDKVITQGLYGSSKALSAGCFFQSIDNSILILTEKTRVAEEIYQDLKFFFPDETIELFPSWDMLPYERMSPFNDIIHHRVMVLHKIVSGNKMIVVSSIEAAIQNIIPKDKFKDQYITIKLDDEIEYEKLFKNLVHLGYSRKTMVEGSGEFSVKGDIVDIFPSSTKNPVRIEFFGDTVERIRMFDAISQRSIEEIDKIEILPQREIVYEEECLNRAFSELENKYLSIKESEFIEEQIINGIYFNGVEHLAPLFYEPFTLIDYLEDAFIIINEKDRINTTLKRVLFEAKEIFKASHKINQVKPLPEELYSSFEDKIKEKKIIEMYFLTHFEGDNVVSFNIGTPEGFKNNLSKLSETMKSKIDEGYKVIVLAAYDGQTKRINDIFASKMGSVIEGDKINEKGKVVHTDITKKNLILGTASISSGLILHNPKLYLILDREIFGKKRSFFKKIHKVNSSPIESFMELNRGDYVVHINYGIGKYQGIERIRAYEKEKDYIKIIYADDESLYIPIEQMNLVQKYVGGSGKTPPLDRLGSKSWERTKAKVKKALEEMAADLAKVYQARIENKGIACTPDSDWQVEFEASFDYEETPDQLRTIEEVKTDMESPKCMDRLICGDVGYGKTEVAIRGCFKCVLNGRQAAVLVPTTILAEQHYETFVDRFKDFPVTIKMLSRFCTKKEQDKTIEDLEKGSVDIVVGTHRLLSKDMKFKNLGLVVIDEEQKFGVRHKEKLKKFRTMVDVLSMSATPIPRTLHMSLTDIRDISIINTPPENRLPIDTYVMEFNEEIIKDAIEKELKRGGQVFFIHNRVKTIDSFADYLQAFFPEYQIGIAHGQMEIKELEDVMHRFISGKFNILVCTTIVESGLDIPNANTILIDRADTLGLSQLYQLRGRVGRSKNKAYCYLFYPVDTVLSETAQKRLSAIREFTDLGSGFKIAMRDLEIRGAGNILGPEQSGDIAAVGFELYCKLLKETVDSVIGEVEIDTLETLVDLRYDGYIPDDYIPDEKQKFEIYKKIVGCTSSEDVDTIKKELKDRFGEFPEIVDSLLKLSNLKVVGKKLRVNSIIETNGRILVQFNQNNEINVLKLMDFVSKDKNVSVNPKKPDTLFINTVNLSSLEQKLNRLHGLFDAIKN